MRRYRGLEVIAFFMLLVVLGCKENKTSIPPAPPVRDDATTTTQLGSDQEIGQNLHDGKTITFSPDSNGSQYTVTIQTPPTTGSCTWDHNPANPTASTVTVGPAASQTQTCTFSAPSGSNSGVLFYSIAFSRAGPVQYSVVSCRGCSF